MTLPLLGKTSLVGFVFACVGWTGAAATEVRLAERGKALLPIIVAPQADASVRELAKELAAYLNRISGATFQVLEGDGRQGIAVAAAADFPALGLARELAGEGFGADEQYLLRSHSNGLYVIGATPTAVQHAVWDLLHRLGCRWFFPGDVWEVVPNRVNLAIALEVRQRPAYAYRVIWPGYGSWPEHAPLWEQWRQRNRVTSTFRLVSGHAYERILSHYRKEFAEHPEWLALVDGKRVPTKFCIANPDLRKLVVRAIRAQVAEKPDERCLSVEPSDGGGWCQCDACRASGSPSDRAITLANEVAAMLQKEHPGKYAALYAYNEHSPPPKIQVHPRVIVSCATSFIRGGLTIDDLILGWKQQGVRQFGIREYYSVHTWDRDLPHAARGGDLDYLARTIPHFHELGARFLSAEASDNWGPNGLGYYIATRMLWDVREASRVQALTDDFLDNCFGPARGCMAEFYAILSGPKRPVLARQLVGRMYRLLDAARAKTDAPAIRARLDALLLYVRYVELFRAYQSAAGESRQKAFEQLMRHGYRMRDTLMIHSLGLVRDLPHRDKAVAVPDDARFNVPAKKNPWKQDPPCSQAELDKLLRDGIAANPVLDYVAWEDRGPLGKPTPPETDRPALDTVYRTRGQQVYYTWFDRAPAALQLTITGGLIAHYRDRGNVKLELFGSPDRTAALCDGKGQTVFRFSQLDGPEVFEVRVPDGEDATYWSFHQVQDRLVLLNVPPYGASHPRALLLPREIKPGP